MPDGDDETKPLPLPASATISVLSTAKFAVMLTAEETVIVHVPVPLHAPVQPTKIEFVIGVAVSVTDVPGEKLALQLVPQSMPAGDDVTVPCVLPPSVIVSGNP